jgi:hypothetical protein
MFKRVLIPLNNLVDAWSGIFCWGRCGMKEEKNNSMILNQEI